MDAILEILGRIGFEPKQALLSLINFSIILFVLGKFVFPKLAEAVAARQAQAKKYIENSEMIEAKLAEAQRDAKTIVDGAGLKATAVIEDAHKKAKELASEMHSDAEAKVASMIEQGKKEIELERVKMQTELHTQTVELVINVTSKILGEKVNAQIDNDYIKETLKSIKK